jgi:hypothetical protein
MQSRDKASEATLGGLQSGRRAAPLLSTRTNQPERAWHATWHMTERI